MNKVIVRSSPFLCLFAVKDIPSGIELRYDYKDRKNLWWRKKEECKFPLKKTDLANAPSTDESNDAYNPESQNVSEDLDSENDEELVKPLRKQKKRERLDDEDMAKPDDFVPSRRFGRKTYLALTNIFRDIVVRADYANEYNMKLFAISELHDKLAVSDHPWLDNIKKMNVNDLKYCVHTLRNKFRSANAKTLRKWGKWCEDVESFYRQQQTV